jgi:hypothetical protein
MTTNALWLIAALLLLGTVAALVVALWPDRKRRFGVRIRGPHVGERITTHRTRAVTVISAMVFTALLFVGAYAWMGGATLPQNAAVGDRAVSERLAEVTEERETADGQTTDEEDPDDVATNEEDPADETADAITPCKRSTGESTVPLSYFSAWRGQEELSPKKVLLIRRTVDANNRRGHAVVEGRAQPKRESGRLVYPGSGIEPAGHCLYSGEVVSEVPHSYAHGAGESISYLYLVYALDTDGQLWVSVNERHGADEYSWDAVMSGETTLREATDDEGVEKVKEYIEQIHDGGT